MSMRVSLLLASVLLASCSNQMQHEGAVATDAASPASDAVRSKADSSKARAPSEPGRHATDVASAPPQPAQVDSAALSQVDTARRFIRTATARFRVDDVYRASNAIEALAARHGGFTTRNDVRAQVQGVQHRSLGNGRRVELATYVTEGSVQVRVPSERTSTFLRELLAQMQFLDARTYEATDAQFELLRQQLAQARAQQAQAALGDAADVGGKLGDRVSAIAAQSDARAARDEATLQRATFEDRVAFATLDLALYQTPRLRRTEMDDIEAALRAEGPGFTTRMRVALTAGWDEVKSLVIGLLALWPLWVITALAIAAGRFMRGARRAG